MTFRRFLAFVLCFVLGFASCVAMIAGAGWIAYSKLSLESLENAGIIDIDENALRDPSAKVDITKMTLQGFVKELSKLSELEETVSIDLLIDRYQLKLPEKILKLIPEGVRDLALTEILSSEGIDAILSNTKVDYLYPFLPSDLLSEPTKEVLADKTLKQVVEMNMAVLLEDVKLGYLLGVEYTKDETTGEYIPTYEDPEEPTLPELLSEVSVYELLDIFVNGGDMMRVAGLYLKDAYLTQVIGAVMDVSELPLAGILEGKKVGDVLVYDPRSGEYDLRVSALFSGTVADAMELTPVYHDALLQDYIIGWEDASGKPVYGVLRGIAEENLMDVVEADFDLMAILTDVYLGDLLSYRPTFDEAGEIVAWTDEDGNEPNQIMAPLVFSTLGDLSDSELDFADLFGGMLLGDMLSYTPIKNDPLDPEKVTGWLDNGIPVSGVDLAMANIDLGRLLGDDSYELSSVFDSFLLGDFLGYEKRIDGQWYEKGTYTKISKFYAAVADLSVGALMAGEASIEDAISDMHLGDVLGYEEHGGDWYEVVDSEYIKVSGIIAAFAGLTVDEISDPDAVTSAMDDVALGEAMGYYYDSENGVWLKSAPTASNPNPDPVSGITAAFADLTVGEMSDDSAVSNVINGIMLGEAMGYYYDSENDVWLESAPTQSNPNPAKVSGVMAALAGTEIGNLSTRLDEAKVGELLGYSEDGGVWKDENGVAASPLINKICGARLDELTSTLDHLCLGDVFTDADLSSGFFALLGDDLDSRKAIELSEISSEATSAMQNAKIGKLMDCDLLSIAPETQAILNVTHPDWRTYTIEEFIEALVNS